MFELYFDLGFGAVYDVFILVDKLWVVYLKIKICSNL